MAIKLKNNVSSTLASAINASDVGITVAAGTGSQFPALGANDYFYATLVSPGGAQEVVRVTARNGDVMSVLRGQDGSTAQSFAAGARVEMRITAQSVFDAVSSTLNYQGASDTNPTVRLDGTPLEPGDFYFNTVSNELRFYNGASWQTITTGSVTVERFTGNGSTTTFTLAEAPLLEEATQIYVNGVYQQKNTYSVSGASLVFTAAPPAGASIEVVTLISIAIGSTSSEKVSYQAAGGGAVVTTVQTKLRETVSVKDFGAVGDGVTDDTVAIQAAIDASANKELVFPAGYTYLSGPLTVANAMSICIQGTLKMKDTSGVLMTITADDVSVYGSGTVDLNSTQDKGIRNTGDRFHIYDLTLANMLGGAATSSSSSALSIASCQAPRVHDLKFKNIEQGTAPLPFVSQPRAMSFDFVTDMLVSDILCEDVFVAAVIGSVEDSTFSNITVINTLATVDNCFYIITSERCVFNNIVIRGWNGEPIVFSGCEDVSFFGGEISNFDVNSCGFENCTRIEIDGMRFVSFVESTIIKSRVANTTTTGVTLRNLYVKVTGSDDIIGFYNGAVNDLVIQNCVFEPVIAVGNNINNRFLTLTSTDSFAITNNTFILRETSAGVAAAADWSITLVATEYSDFKQNTFINRTTNGRFRIQGTNNNLISSNGLHNQSNITGSRNPNYGLTTAEPRVFYGTDAPSAGTFIRGDIIYSTVPSAGGTVGWICTTAGTPGTWKTFGAISA